jgi:hypothetical protein
MFLKREIRIGAAVALVAVLALASAAPAGAAGWSGWGEAREWSGEIVPRVLSWLGLGSAFPKCDDGASIDPNGCPKAVPSKCEQGSQIDPNGCPGIMDGAKADDGSQIDPNGQH